MKNNPRLFSLVLLINDFFILFLVFGLSYLIRVKYDNRPLLHAVYSKEYIISSLIVVPIWIFGFFNLGLYTARVYKERLLRSIKIVIGSITGILLIIGWEYFTQHYIFPARLVTLYVFVSATALLIFSREILHFVQTQLFKKQIGVEKVLLIGKNQISQQIVDELSYNIESGYQIAATVGLNYEHLPYYKTLDQALKNLKNDKITTVIQTEIYTSSKRNQKILTLSQTNHLKYYFIPGEAQFYYAKSSIETFLELPVISVQQTPLTGWGSIIKRCFDFVISLIAIIILSPLFLILIILQKIFSPGPVFYVSKRLSRYSIPFDLYKFRSMGAKYGSKDAALEFEEMNRPDLAAEYRQHRKVVNDPRITKFGNFLRKTSLDELPQLFNVLKGDLSLVGPRPILPQEVNFSQQTTALLHSVKSGVTGLWQVSGRNSISFDKRIEIETYYAQNWSFWLDIKILIKTVKVVFTCKNVK